MIEDLKHIEKTVLMDLLKNPSIWNTLDVNYYPPRVERLWTQLEDQRLMLHIIHPCEPLTSLYHPHAWPSVMHVLDGKYEMGLGIKHSSGMLEKIAIQKGKESPSFIVLPKKKQEDQRTIIRQICKLEMNGDNYYEMLDIKGWHYVRPINNVCLTVMLTGEPWSHDIEYKVEKDGQPTWGKLPELTEHRKLEILEIFKEHYRLFLK